MATPPSTAASRLDAALDQAADEQVVVNAAAGRRTVALARVLGAARVVPEALLDVGVERVASAAPERRSSVAHRALVAEVACMLGVSEHVAAGWLADADVLASKATATLEALCAGSITYQHAAKLADAVGDLPPSVAGQVERAVLGRAPDMTAARFGVLARAARDRLHPVPAEVRHQAAALKAGVWVDDGSDGMSWLTAHLPTPVARAAYDRLHRTATRAKTTGDPRGVGQLRAATLTALLLDEDHTRNEADPPGRETDPGSPPGTPPGSAPGTAPGSGPPGLPDPSTAPTCAPLPDPLATLARTVRPAVHVTVPITTLTGTGESPGLLDGTIPVDAETARHLVTRAPTLRRLLTDPVTGALLTADRRSYVVPADLRAFLTQRDLTCRFPGCRIPARRCDLDHTTAWEHGGTTDSTNLAALCRRHHTLKHESRWAVEHLAGPDRAGVLAWTSPRGRTYLTTPGSADHTLGDLDEWASEADHLVLQPAPTIDPTDAALPPEQTADPVAVRDDGDPPF
ncbi:DUF222 domain-containing protein [Isoptericola sp. NPDC060257]|uniref:HNH endonuclease signature motif containing protein n=1 Tax=Isoptericola sp. NPDC060257 TaxID=3347087 RepID=UPI00365C8E00